MYLDFYGLKESAFNLVTDPRFMYYSESHCEAMAHLLYGVREKKGIIVMLGEAGTGKTTLVRATLNMLQKTRVVPSAIMNPMISSTEDLLDAILRGFAISGYKKNTLDMAEVLQRFALQQSRQGKIPVIVIDEAQELTRQLLEQVRMLSNLETNGGKMLQIVLSAQPEMNERLETHELRALRQRVTVRCQLNSLSAEETWRYLSQRISVAGGQSDIFAEEAVERMYEYSGGIPRILNSLADNCLLAGFARGMRRVSGPIVEQVAKHLDLLPAVGLESSAETIHRDIVRASATWKEVSGDIRGGAVPAALKAFAEKLQTPEFADAAVPMAIRKGAQL